ncbi:MAG: hypothetical protein IJC63_08530 [Myxococcaceae bacterium]|nr:hypothetical protein [Myxococcaceae bacterium]
MSPSRFGRGLQLAAILYLVVAIGISLVGCAYLVSPSFMPYHAQIVGMAWGEVPERFRWLLSAFQRGAGALALALAVALAAIAWIPLRRGEMWARCVLVVLSLVAGAPFLFIVRHLAVLSGASVPLAPLVASTILLALAAVASFWPSGSSSAPTDADSP